MTRWRVRLRAWIKQGHLFLLTAVSHLRSLRARGEHANGSQPKPSTVFTHMANIDIAIPTLLPSMPLLQFWVVREPWVGIVGKACAPPRVRDYRMSACHPSNEVRCWLIPGARSPLVATSR